ncbi:uncharacterized protein [Euwallacea similis]|uniref:uncharacterized protein n=1 Tax=Euwallacea similis TaxID=1736056 RepID=UPI00344CB9F5
MSKQALLSQYKHELNKIKSKAKSSGLSEDEFNKLVEGSFQEIKTTNVTQNNNQKQFKICILISLLLSLVFYVLLNIHTPTSSIVLRNVQGFTYPALKIIRTVSLPLIKLFPSLTDLYDESCLVKNPHFYLADLDCSPCENVHSVIDLSGITSVNPYEKVSEGIPLVLKTSQHKVLWKDLQELYQNHSSILKHEMGQFLIKNMNVNPDILFTFKEEQMSSNVHVEWRIKKMAAARIIRKPFPKPNFFPDRSGQDIERFVYIDGPIAESYSLPNPECSYVFIIQGIGERTITLKPTKECQKQCKSVSVTMRPSYVLLYNWWYWRPVSLPSYTNSNLSISYMNSYC